jgi:hypothetical protein
MADVFTIAGSGVNMDAMDAIPVRFAETFGEVPTLTLQRRGVALPGLPDPWLGKSVTWTSGGTLRFVGNVVSLNPSFDERLGWVLTYQCLGFRFRLNWFPHTDSKTGIDTTAFNLTRTDPNYDAAQAGRSIGQMLTAVLQMATNAGACVAAGIGNYTGTPPTYTLPAVTQADLAKSAFGVIPPRPVYFTGEKFGDALEALLAQWAPNHRMWIDPQGNFRFLDLSDATQFPNTTLTLGVDPIEPTEISRDTSNCYPRVLVRGQPIAVMASLQFKRGDLKEAFGWGAYGDTDAGSNNAKAAWDPAKFTSAAWGDNNQYPTISTGTITTCTTTVVTIQSAVAGENWIANYWDQSDGTIAGTGHHGTVNLYASSLGGAYTQCWSARIISNTALAAGGTCDLTIDSPLPGTQYDKYTISGYANNAQIVWTRYKVINTALAARFTWQSTYPQPIVNASGSAASLVNSPLAIIQRSDGTSFPLSFSWSSSGEIRFIAPTYIMAGSPKPYSSPTWNNFDIWMYMPVYTNELVVQSPAAGGYSGTSSTVEGLQKTLTVTIDQWTDPGQMAQMQTYSDSLQRALRDTVTEGEVVYYDLYAQALTFGMALSIAANYGPHVTCSTGWEGLQIPVRSVAVEWPQGTGQPYITHMSVSNRKGVYDASQYLRPARRVGYPSGADGVISPFGVAIPTTSAEGFGGIERRMPTGFGPTEGTGMPDIEGQLVAGMDFGAGITVPTGPAAIARESAAASRLPLPTGPAPVEPGVEGVE